MRRPGRGRGLLLSRSRISNRLIHEVRPPGNDARFVRPAAKAAVVELELQDAVEAGILVLPRRVQPPETMRMICAQAQPPYVPTPYPSTASSTPTGARLGWKAAAITGADAAPPMFAWLPTAR